MTSDVDERAATKAWLDSLGPDAASDLIETAISDAIAQRELTAVPGLIALMCCYDPHRADRVHRALLDATQGRITVTVDLDRKATS